MLSRREFCKWLGMLPVAGGLCGAVAVPKMGCKWKEYYEHFDRPDGWRHTVLLVDYTVTFYEKMNLDRVMAMRDMIAKVNHEALPLGDRIHQPETLLFRNFKQERDEHGMWKTELLLTARSVKAMDQELPGGWNHFWQEPQCGVYRALSGFYRLKEWRQDDPFKEHYFNVTYIKDDLKKLFA